MAAALRLCCALLLLQVLHSCAAVAIYDPQDADGDLDNPRGLEDGDDDGAGVITVHAGKRKPALGSRVPPPPPQPPSSRDSGCPQSRRRRSAPRSSKPMPVREKLHVKRSADSNFHCPESWKELNFSEVQELECPENATGWYPFPPDCRKYLNCWKGRGFLQACAPATLFHPIRRECDYPEKVKCLPSCRSDHRGDDNDSDSDEEDGIMGDPVDYVDPEHPRRPSPLIDVRSASGPLRRVAPGATAAAATTTTTTTTPRTSAGRARRQVYSARLAGGGGVQCQMEGGTGLQAHPTDCTKFVNCWQGKPHIQSCAPGSLFSTRLNACDHPNKVTECVGGKRVAPGAAAPPAQPAGALPASYTQAGGGYNQFGNQGYQPPPRQTFLTAASYPDQVPAASSFNGYVPNQVLPPPGAGGKGKSLHPELQPRPPSQQFGWGAAPRPLSADPNLDVEGIESGGVIGPLPRPHPGHNEEWHRDHGVPMPGSGVPPGHNPAYHQHHHHHHEQQGNRYTPHPPGHHHAGHSPQPGNYNPQQGSYTPSPGRYTPSQSGYNPQPGDYNPQQGGYGGYDRPSGGYTPQPSRYDPQPQEGGYTPHAGHHPHAGHNAHPGHNPQWHHDHGVPMPGGQRGTGYAPTTTTPSYDPPTTTCAPEEDDDNDFRENDFDLRSAGSSNWVTVVERTKNTSMPQSGQMVRIRGGPTPLEGYVEVMGPGSKWGSVCDKPADWTVEEASIVCRMLGYERGAELAWQGRPRGSPGVLDVHVEEVYCSGQERSLMSCSMSAGDAGDGCNLETQAAGLRCYPNYVARCRPGEVPFKGSCYSVVIPRQDRKVDAIAFSQDEAIKHCKSQGGHLLDINSQAENDFISEWLTTAHPALGSVLTSGVGVSVPGRDVWVWEDTGAQFKYNLWWPGPPSKEFDPARAPKVSDRPLCILLKKDFPCDTWPGAVTGGRGAGRGGGYGSWQGVRSCGAEYFFWHGEDCAIRQKSYPYVCERKADDVGCLGPSGTEYEGTANVSWNGLSCVNWDSPAAVSALRYRVSEDVRQKSLSGHNYCRTLAGGSAGNQEPWCFVDAGASGIKAERCDVPRCRENTGNSTDSEVDATVPLQSGVTVPTPGLYEANGRPRPPASEGDSPFPSLSRPYPPTFLPRSRDDPLADPRGTATATDRPWPTLPTSRPFFRPDEGQGLGRGPGPSTTPAWPDPFAGRSTTPRPRALEGRGGGPRRSTPPAGRVYPSGSVTARPREVTTLRPSSGSNDPEWPVNYAPGFSHREVGPTPQPPPVPPSRDLQPPYQGGVQPPRTTPTPSVYRDREEYVEPEGRDDGGDYANVPDPLRMDTRLPSLSPRMGASPDSDLGPTSAPTTGRPAGTALGYGARPDPRRGYGLPDGAPRRPPVATARPPAELYNYLLPGQSYAPYPYAADPSQPQGPQGRPSYSNLFGLLPAMAPVALSYYPSEGTRAVRDPLDDYPDQEGRGPTATTPSGSSDTEDPYGLFSGSSESSRQPTREGRYPSPTVAYPFRGPSPGSSYPYSQVGYYPPQRATARTPSGNDEDDSEQDSGSESRESDGRAERWPTSYNGHSGPGGAPSRQSRTAEEPVTGAATIATPALTATLAPTTNPPFSRPNVKVESEHVMKIPKSGETSPALQITTEKIFFM